MWHFDGESVLELVISSQGLLARVLAVITTSSYT